MAIEVYDENKLRDLSEEERIIICERIIKDDIDESKRWDAIWLLGEIAENKNQDDPVFEKVADLMEWTLRNDSNGVVKHEACYQIDDYFQMDIDDTRFMNHSYEPNTVDFPSDVPIMIVAEKDIEKDEEGTRNYLPFMNPFQVFKCSCGSKNCVGTVKKINFQ